MKNFAPCFWLVSRWEHRRRDLTACNHSLIVIVIVQVSIFYSKMWNITTFLPFVCTAGISHSLSLHLFQGPHVWWPYCLIRSWMWPTLETRGVSSAIKTATPFLYRMTTNLTSWKNARGSRKPVRKQMKAAQTGELSSVSFWRFKGAPSSVWLNAEFLNSWKTVWLQRSRTY